MFNHLKWNQSKLNWNNLKNSSYEGQFSVLIVKWGASSRWSFLPNSAKRRRPSGRRTPHFNQSWRIVVEINSPIGLNRLKLEISSLNFLNLILFSILTFWFSHLVFSCFSLLEHFHFNLQVFKSALTIPFYLRTPYTMFSSISMFFSVPLLGKM